MPTYEGRLDAKGLRIALLASRFNETITKSLLDGALSALRRHGLDDASITVAWVPGAFELPMTAKRLADSGEHADDRRQDHHAHGARERLLSAGQPRPAASALAWAPLALLKASSGHSPILSATLDTKCARASATRLGACPRRLRGAAYWNPSGSSPPGRART